MFSSQVHNKTIVIYNKTTRGAPKDPDLKGIREPFVLKKQLFRQDKGFSLCHKSRESHFKQKEEFEVWNDLW